MRVHHSSSRSGGVTVRDAVAFVDKMMAPPHERGCKEQAVNNKARLCDDRVRLDRFVARFKALFTVLDRVLRGRF